MKRRVAVTIILAVVLFSLVTLFWIPYQVTDVPTRYGVPFIFREKGCYYINPPNCVDRFRPDLLITDLLITAMVAYGIAWFFTRKASYE